MVVNTRYFAQHVVDWVAANGKGFCGHQDPEEPDAPYRKGTYLGEIGLQNCWCGYVDPQSAPITGDPWHCGNMEARDGNEWGLGHVLQKSNGNGYQVQDIGTDHAYMTVVIEKEALTTPSSNVKVQVLGEGIDGGPDPVQSSRPFRFMGKVQQVQLSESSCFVGATWQPWAPELDYQLSAGDGRKLLYARLKDENGHTFVTWDSIFVGQAPDQVSSFDEGIRRIQPAPAPVQGRLRRVRVLDGAVSRSRGHRRVVGLSRSRGRPRRERRQSAQARQSRTRRRPGAHLKPVRTTRCPWATARSGSAPR